MPSMDSVVTSLGDVRPHTRQVAHEIADQWTLYFIWGDGPSGEHAEGRALDFMGMRLGGGVNSPGAMRHHVCDEIADYLWQHRERLGVWYIIWNRRIISMTYEASGWRGYDGSNPHTDHVHVSFYNGVSYQPPHDEEDDLPSPKDVWTYRTDNLKINDNGKRIGQGGKASVGWMVADIEATVDYIRRQIADLPDAVWDEQRVKNRPAKGGKVDEASPRWVLSNLESTQDQQHKETRARLDALEQAIGAIGDGLGKEVGQAVRDALAEATVDVNVNVRQGADGEEQN